jgi:hypothetical protein
MWEEADVREVEFRGHRLGVGCSVSLDGSDTGYVGDMTAIRPSERESELFRENDSFWGPVGGQTVGVTIPPGVSRFSLRDIGTTLSVSDVFINRPADAVSPVSASSAAPVAPLAALVSCDLRVVRVSDGSLVASASRQNAYGRLGRLAEELADDLKSGVKIKGEAVALAPLVDRTGTIMGQAVAKEAADKIAGAMVKTGWFEVRERIELRTVVDERDLQITGLTKDPDVRTTLAGVKHVVVGGVTIMGVGGK